MVPDQFGAMGISKMQKKSIKWYPVMVGTFGFVRAFS